VIRLESRYKILLREGEERKVVGDTHSVTTAARSEGRRREEGGGRRFRQQERGGRRREMATRDANTGITKIMMNYGNQS
jgi:hypothetical protein